MERDLPTRTDRFGVEVRERTMWDIRTGVVGADTFLPKHVAIITWKNMTFAGGIGLSLFTVRISLIEWSHMLCRLNVHRLMARNLLFPPHHQTNSFQMVLATDEVYTYAIFNYGLLSWSSHTEAGGDTTGGEGGVPAFVSRNDKFGTSGPIDTKITQNPQTGRLQCGQRNSGVRVSTIQSGFGDPWFNWTRLGQRIPRQTHFPNRWANHVGNVQQGYWSVLIINCRWLEMWLRFTDFPLPLLQMPQHCRWSLLPSLETCSEERLWT